MKINIITNEGKRERKREDMKKNTNNYVIMIKERRLISYEFLQHTFIISVCQASLCVQPIESDVTAIKEGGEDNVKGEKKVEKKTNIKCIVTFCIQYNIYTYLILPTLIIASFHLSQHAHLFGMDFISWLRAQSHVSSIIGFAENC